MDDLRDAWRCENVFIIYPIPSHLISSHLISSHLISPHLTSSHLISSHLISSEVNKIFDKIWEYSYNLPNVHSFCVVDVFLVLSCFPAVGRRLSLAFASSLSMLLLALLSLSSLCQIPPSLASMCFNVTLSL